MSGAGRRELRVVRLGRVPYDEALELQRAAARARISGALPEDLLLLVEHPPVVTLGRSSKDQHLLCSPAALRAQGIEVHEVERGGDVTWHGPGQLVGYPIIDLKRHRQDLHWYLRQVEAALISALAEPGLAADRNPGKTGVWVGGRKIASIGVHARDWVTWHGFALNVTTDLAAFDVIVPCGIAGVEMTSVAREVQRAGASAERLREITLDTASGWAAAAFAATFGLEVAGMRREELERAIAAPPVLPAAGTPDPLLPAGAEEVSA